MKAAWLSFTMALCACVSAAPKNADQQAHALWASFAADDNTLRLALERWHDVAKGAELTADKSGKLTDLSRSEVNDLSIPESLDPSDARGAYFFNVITGCTLDQIEAIETAANQAELFPNTYDAFERIYMSDQQAYLARQTRALQWRSRFTDTVMDASYDTELKSLLRRINFGDDHAIVSRTYQPRPATIRNDADAEVTQDFQLDAYYPREDGKIMHVHLLWGHLRIGAISTDDDIVLSVMLSNLKGWDDVRTKHCERLSR
jgi:hypothetical protein